MDFFIYPAARMVLYLLTLGTAVLFGLSVYSERRRMRNCVFLVLTLYLIWESITVVAGYVYWTDIDGLMKVPVMVLAFLFAIGMIADGLFVIKKEGFSIAHSLTLLVGGLIIAVGAVYLGLILYTLHMQKLESELYMIPRALEAAFNICMELAAYLPMMMIGFGLYSVIYQRLPIKRKPDYIVVLGCGLSGDRVTPLLASRLDRGLLYDKKMNSHSIFLVSGGKGKDEAVSEAQAMERYLLEKGIPQGRIIKEDKSATTRENLLFSRKIMEERTKDYFCIISTNNFHVLRAAIFARNLGVKGEVIGGKTASYYHPTAAIREYAALILAYKALFFTYAAVVVIFNLWRYLCI
ncbi:MAG: YdcF family protein [Lachnospiraceae bacterium]|nr:YdcF family protein [Lachnospiraceae bacterium]